MFKKILAFFMIAVIAASALCFTSGATASASLSDVYWDGPNGKLCFTLTYSGMGKSAWVALVPEGTATDENSANDKKIVWKWVADIKSGKPFSMSADLKEGKYALYVYSDWPGGKLVCSKKLTVGKPTASLSDVYWDKSKETVYFTLSYKDVRSGAWIGIVPQGTAKDEKSANNAYKAYKYLKEVKNGKQDSITAKGLKDGEYSLYVFSAWPGGTLVCSQNFSTEKKKNEGRIAEITIILDKGDTIKLGTVIEPTDAEVAWSSSNEKVAAVSSSGKVTAKKKGTAIITAKSGSSTKTIKIVVED